MQITDVTIDHFCGLENVALNQLSPQFNVICGGPGSGKRLRKRFVLNCSTVVISSM